MEHLDGLEAHFIDSIRSLVICPTSTDIALQHTHPPLRFRVETCEYCMKYGNIYANK